MLSGLVPTPQQTVPMTMVVEQLLNWPRRQAEKIHANELLENRVRSMVRHGFVVSSDFSGQLSAETALKMQLRGCDEVRMGGGGDVDDSLVFLYSACDLAEEPRKICLESPVEHVFPEILSQIPDAMAQEIRRRRPSTHTGPNTKGYPTLGNAEAKAAGKKRRRESESQLQDTEPNIKDPSNPMPQPKVAKLVP
eukprot:6776748-Alexandrium_andersonii.AAC.1